MAGSHAEVGTDCRAIGGGRCCAIANRAQSANGNLDGTAGLNREGRDTSVDARKRRTDLGKISPLERRIEAILSKLGQRSGSCWKNVEHTGRFSEGRARRRISLRAACRAQQLLPVNSISFDESTSPAALLDIVDAHDLLSWQASRCENWRSGAPRDDITDLSQRIRSYRTQAAKLPQQPPYLHEAPTPIACTGPSTLSLEADPEHSVELQLKWSGSPKTPTWVSLHFDPDLIDVKTSTEISVAVNGKASFVQPVVPLNRPMTFELFADRSTPLRLVVRRREGATGRARLVVHAVTKQGSARHDVDVSLPMRPSLELGIDGIAGSWSVKDNVLRLHPFANRQSSYSLGLISKEPVAREVSFRILAPRRRPRYVSKFPAPN